jgi:hypothetical protein
MTANPRESRAIVGRRIPITVKRDGAGEVMITGDWNNWSTDGTRLSHDGAGTWRTALELAPGEYQYRLIVDGVWQDDPDAHKRVPNPFGSENCVLIVE